MERTFLTTLIETQVQRSVVSTLQRSVDHVAESMAVELLRDPEFRAQLQAAMRLAFAKTLQQLNESQPNGG